VRFRARSNRPRTLEQDLTPLIDVVFQLLIFFLTTTQLAAQAQMELDLPRERGEQRGGGRDPGLIVNLTRTGEIVILDSTRSLQELATIARRVRLEQGEIRPVVRADRGAPAAALNALFTTLRESGIEGVTLAVSPGR